ncbi:MAG TPA: hypothetical protein DDY43_02750 [Synechococcales bacterium UBA10510]|nr:hypothetical protein [Synechococcales bacterium UBA10510]
MFTYIYLEPRATGLAWPDSYSHGPTLPITQKPSEAPAAFLLPARPAPPGIVAYKHWQPEALVIDKQW